MKELSSVNDSGGSATGEVVSGYGWVVYLSFVIANCVVNAVCNGKNAFSHVGSLVFSFQSWCKL